jgi:hypothetical protein
LAAHSMTGAPADVAALLTSATRPLARLRIV